MDRTILHCDCNGFYASVECALNPSLGKGPMAVCGDPKSRHGIILAKNEAAKAYGVQTAETVWQAKKKCPSLTLVLPHFDEYESYSSRVNRIYEDYTDLVEPFGIDESWLDVTGTLHIFGNPQTIADEIRRRVKEELKITVSVGVSFNKVFAKLGSDYKKPDATTLITRENYKEILYPLPAGSLLYVGKASQASLAALGIATIGQLAAYDRALLAKRLGKAGETIWDFANGLDESPVASFHEGHTPKSVGNGSTFPHDLSGYDEVMSALLTLCDTVATRLRSKNLSCETLSVSVKYPDFKTISRQKRLPRPTFLAKEMALAAWDILRQTGALASPIRSLTVTATGLRPADEPYAQLSLFGGEEREGGEKQRHIEEAMDHIRAKYGFEAIHLGSSLREKLGGIAPKRKSKKEKT